MAEQNFEQATRIATRGYVLVHGRVILAADSVAALKAATSSVAFISEPVEVQDSLSNTAT